jgi:hypothetical protein
LSPAAVALLEGRVSDEPTQKDVDVLVVQFLVPVYDRGGHPYRRSIHRQVRRDLEDRFDGWSLAADKPLPGAWRNPASGEVECDDSWRYEVGIASDRLQELDAYLGELAHRLGQEALWRVVYAGGEGKVIAARPPRNQ